MDVTNGWIPDVKPCGNREEDGVSAVYSRGLGLFITPCFVCSVEVAKHVYICSLDTFSFPVQTPTESVPGENICPRGAAQAKRCFAFLILSSIFTFKVAGQRSISVHTRSS